MMMATDTRSGLWCGISLSASGEVGGACTTSDAGTMAKGVLSILLDTLYFEMPEPIPPLPSNRLAQEETEDEIAESPTETDYFKVYPNPFNQQVTIAYDLKEDCTSGCFIMITDIRGRTVFETAINSNGGPNSVTFELGRYETGMYICSLYNNQRLLQTSRLIRME